eukprot:1593713-Amphidinium_carterae.2
MHTTLDSSQEVALCWYCALGCCHLPQFLECAQTSPIYRETMFQGVALQLICSQMCTTQHATSALVAGDLH